MKTTELIDKMVEETGHSRKEVQKRLDATLDELTTRLSTHEGFSIPDLGTFKPVTKEVRKIYNPHYKSYILIPPKRVVDFTQSATLKDKLKFIRPDDE